MTAAPTDETPGGIGRLFAAAPCLAAPLVFSLAVAGGARGGEVDTAVQVAPVVVVAATPLPGAGIDIDKTPANTQTLGVADLSREGPANLTGALSDQLGSININENLDDAFQPDILLRGFEASPVLGTPQGVAVYQNGVRINEAFGDTVDWDLIPDIAIRRVDVMGANPVFGLNTLGGAVVVSMKDGFTDPGGDAAIFGGAFGRRDAAGEVGANDGRFGVYLAARALDEDGWREFSPNHLREVYGDVGAHAGGLILDLSVTAADNRLFGESPTPVQELAVNRVLVFTSPQENDNRLAFVTLDAAYQATSTLSVQGALYYRGFWQAVINGNTTDYTACAPGGDTGYLCQSDGLTPLTTGAGQPIPDISHGGAVPIGENDGEKIDTTGVGGSAQATSTAALFGRENHLSIGGGLDRAVTDFSSDAQVGTINAALQVSTRGYYVDTPENTPFDATPVALRATTTYYGLYATDTFNLTPRLAVTASGRYNLARIGLADRLGHDLSGDNRYRRLNPALGATYKAGEYLTAYAGYSEGSRAPDPSEIECSNPLNPCLLPSSLASDPPTLKQVVSRTWETGLRGRFALARGALAWNAGVFRTDVHDDIYGVATSLSAGYFQNIPGDRRQGVEAGVRYSGPKLTLYASYSHIDATFRSAFLLPSPSNPFQDAAGNIRVLPGDHLPGIPRDRLKLGADAVPRPGWSVGTSIALVGDQYYFGDESNQLAPLPGYVVVGLHSSVELTRRLSVFATAQNALNARYSTFGILGDPTGVGAPGIPAGAATNGPGVDNRFQSPAAPISAYGGLKLRF
jgi:iron complex outermembrane receptor protein